MPLSPQTAAPQRQVRDARRRTAKGGPSGPTVAPLRFASGRSATTAPTRRRGLLPRDPLAVDTAPSRQKEQRRRHQTQAPRLPLPDKGSSASAAPMRTRGRFRSSLTAQAATDRRDRRVATVRSCRHRPRLTRAACRSLVNLAAWYPGVAGRGGDVAGSLLGAGSPRTRRSAARVCTPRPST